MNTDYTYKFYLDTTAETPLLETSSLNGVEQLSETIRIYTFKGPAVSFSQKINDLVQYTETMCANTSYKLLVVGESEGHIEVYKSEEYEGPLGVYVGLVKKNNE
jgi:hypothetical protein